MVQTLNTNSSGDIFRDAGGNLSLLSGVNAVSAACKTAGLLQLGEAVLQVNQGIPNLETVWSGSPNYAVYASYLRKAIEAVDGVNKISDLSIEAKNNVLSYAATINTIYGKAAL